MFAVCVCWRYVYLLLLSQLLLLFIAFSTSFNNYYYIKELLGICMETLNLLVVTFYLVLCPPAALIVFVISKLFKCHSTAKRRAPVYSRGLVVCRPKALDIALENKSSAYD